MISIGPMRHPMPAAPALRPGPGELSVIAGASCDQQGRARLVSWIARRHGHAEAEDLLHEAFVRFEQLRRKTAVADPAGFLLHAAANLAVDQYRKRRHLAPEPFELACAGIADPAPAIDEVLFARDRLDRVQQALDSLSARTRAVFLMHRIEGRKYREIAASVGISQSAVEKHIARAAAFLASWTEQPNGPELAESWSDRSPPQR